MRASVLLSVSLLALAGHVQASSIASSIAQSGGSISAMSIGGPNATIVPLIVAGAPPDSPSARVDANLPSSPFSGVVSINIRYDDPAHPGTQLSFICSGSLVSPTQVLSAGHCVDTDGKGHVVDITKPGNDVRIVFNSQPNPGDPGRAIVTATKVVLNPNYQGFGNCPSGVAGFCLNDDLSIITIPAGSAPASAKVYRVNTQVQALGTVFTQVGYGLSGDGINGYTVNPDFRVKRSGSNSYDAYDTNDEANFAAGSAREVWYADFDGPPGSPDTGCTLLGFFHCGGTLGNSIEDNIGGGDSGGPSFVLDAYGNYVVVANDTFGGTLPGQKSGTFGTFFGGILLSGYDAFLHDNLIGAAFVPEPETLLLMLVGLAGLGLSRRARRIGAKI